ncbi:MAG: hypothetical protein V9F03_10245 [Microthrixaceae bacterium]
MNSRRDPADLARFLASAMALAIAAFLRVERPQSLRNLSGDLVSLAARLPDVVQVVVVGSTQLASIAAAVGMIIVVAIQRRWRVVIPVFASGLAAGVLTALTTDWVSRTAPGTGTLLPRPSWIIGPTFPSAAFLSAVVAAVVTASPTWSRSWRRAAWVAVGVVSLSRILTAATVPVGIGASVLVGMTVGSAVLYLVGIPRVRVATSVIRAALEDQGLLLDAIVPTDAESTSEFAYSARDSEGAPIDVFLVDRRDRDADLFARVVRSLKVKDVDADQAGLSPSRIVEHAALAGLMAHSHGISVRAVRAVGSTADGDGFIAYVGQDRDRLVDLDRDGTRPSTAPKHVGNPPGTARSSNSPPTSEPDPRPAFRRRPHKRRALERAPLLRDGCQQPSAVPRYRRTSNLDHAQSRHQCGTRRRCRKCPKG